MNETTKIRLLVWPGEKVEVDVVSDDEEIREYEDLKSDDDDSR
jgi:hypothetical protein